MKYPKIPEGRLPESIKATKSSKWAVTEKVHGANFCISTDHGTDFQFFKRTGPIIHSDRFFGFRESPTFLPQLLPRISSLYTAILIQDSSIKTVKVWGELCGGFYPSLSPTTSVPVQQGVYYAADLQFYAFDISIVTSDGSESFLSFSDAVAFFSASNFLHAKPLKIADLSTCLSYPIGFDSHVPGWLQLPPLPKGTNKAEGIVVRLYSSMQGKKGKELVTEGGNDRPLVKFKIPEFAETSVYDNRRDRQAFAGSFDVEMATEAVELMYELQAMVTHERFQGIISKHGRLEDAQGEREDVVTEYADALFADIVGDYAALYGSVKEELVFKVQDAVKQTCRAIVTNE
ncbi:hypothetical protein HDU79_005078 [Rhizoclosmatium sp. JEL0117]|nr:hypothetical protein HDU79_005078 [Rhizoclosmatium sp. JEL0117]